MFIIDTAPGKELILQLSDSPSKELLESFFFLRARWHGCYPLIHDRFVTYGLFDDMTDELSPECRVKLIPAMMDIAESAPDSYFHAAIFLLAHLIPKESSMSRPLEFSNIFLRLRLRAEKLAFLPNLECAWNSLANAQRLLHHADDPLSVYTPKQLGISTSRWREFFAFPLINFKRENFEHCLADMGNLRQKFLDLDCPSGQRNLIYCTRIEKTWYWVWKVPGVRGVAHLMRLVYLRQTSEGDLGLGYWDLYRQFNERDTSEAISERLLNIEFSDPELDRIDRKSTDN